jgi:hypothetical protein
MKIMFPGAIPFCVKFVFFFNGDEDVGMVFFQMNTLPLSSALKVEAVCSSETVISTYMAIRSYNTEEEEILW